MALITQTEVISIAFTEDVKEAYIKDAILEAAQIAYIRPFLQESLYDAVIADTSAYAALITKLKSPLAYFVKYMSYDDLVVKVTDRGAFQLTSDEGQFIGNNTKNDAKNSSLNVANAWLTDILDYIQKRVAAEDVLYYNIYQNTEDVVEEDDLIGGFLIE
jgi:hypothetical protein